MRRAARLLQIHRTTVARKLAFLADQARQADGAYIAKFRNLAEVQFDELETFEHSKYKPLSVAMAVLVPGRKILGFEVAPMPAKGPLAHIARRRYGLRSDRRGKALRTLFSRIAPQMAPEPTFKSDQNPRYPLYLREFFPNAHHLSFEGRRGCVVGQGELKRGRWDPLFSLNHTFAMLRANVNRLFRRTWCTTKKARALSDHLALYAHYHNTVLT